MISSFPSYDEELLNSAYANINLIADKAWTFDKEGDSFQKLNHSLSIQVKNLHKLPESSSIHLLIITYVRNIDILERKIKKYKV